MTADAQLRTLRIAYTAIWASALTYPVVAQLLAPPGEIGKSVYVALCVLAVALALTSVLLRKTMLGGAERRNDRGERQPAMQIWLVGQIASFFLAEAVVFFGLVIRFAGATLKQALPLYVLGIAVLLMIAPQRFEAPGA